ncbi:MAG: PLP-dependent aminotransferase family protein [Terracidiphilus sp.]
MKRATTLELMLPLRDRGEQAQRWLYAALRGEILAGRLRPGARLPATRELARQYGLSRGTIVNAFEQLKSEGYIEAATGSGSYVSKVLPDDLLQVAPPMRDNQAANRKQRRAISEFASRATPFPNFENRPSRAFRANLPALDLFPTSLWAQVASRRLRRVSTNLLLGCGAMGYLPLRKAIAGYLTTSRGVKCSAEQVAIVSGVQEALDLTARIFLNPGDRACMENPGYIGAAFVFRAAGARVVPIGVDEEGMLIRAASLRGARLVYVTPGHQFPLGITMSLQRRLQLLEWARETATPILEDDYDSEYRYAGRPVPALQGLDANGLVLFTGSFSKVLFPSLRLGYLVVPADLVDRVAAIVSITSRHAPLLDQAVLCDFIEEGHFGRHLRRMRQIYAARLSVLLECAKSYLAGLLEICGVEAGLQTAGWLCGGLDGESCFAAAAIRKVEAIPLSWYGLGGKLREGLQLGFAAVDEKQIRRGVEELARVLESELRKPRRGSGQG